MGGSKARPRKPAKESKKFPKLKPDGEEDGCKRTPLGNYDPYKGRRSYKVLEVKHKRLQKGSPEYNVQWLGIPAAGNTWEPKEHLAAQDGQDAIKCFEERERLLLEQVILSLFHRVCFSVRRVQI